MNPDDHDEDDDDDHLFEASHSRDGHFAVKLGGVSGTANQFFRPSRFPGTTA